VGSSSTSWEDAVREAIESSSKSLWNLRIAKVKELDVELDANGKVIIYRARMKLSFKHDDWKRELGWKT